LIYLVDSAGVIQGANPAAAALLPCDHVDGMTLAGLAHVDDRHEIDRLLVGACAETTSRPWSGSSGAEVPPDPRQVL
jgi:PAS domain-containing protein